MTFNRTSLELKLILRDDRGHQVGSFNRTSLELKHSKPRLLI